MRRHDPERHPRGARAHTARAFRRHQRPRHCADRRRRAAEEPGQAHPRGDGAAGFHRRRSAGLGGTRNGQDAERFPPAAPGFDRLTRRASGFEFRSFMLAVPSRHRSLVLLAVVLTAQVLLLAAQIKRDQQVRLIRAWAVAAVTPFERAGSWAIDRVRGGWSNYVGLVRTRRENQDLRAELDRLKLRNSGLEGRAAEADRLAGLLGFREAHGDVPMLAARVIGASADTASKTVSINRGENDGVRKNMAVITPEGVVGKVLEAYAGTSQVLLLTDKDSGVGALLADSRVQGVVGGLGEFLVQMKYVSNDENIAAG